MAKINPKWRVDPEPIGSYRAFAFRGFPSANYPNGEPCASIRCKDSYHPANHKDATNLVLEVWVAVYENDNSWNWARMTARPKSIAEAKKQVHEFVNSDHGIKVVHPDYRKDK